MIYILYDMGHQTVARWEVQVSDLAAIQAEECPPH